MIHVPPNRCKMHLCEDVSILLYYGAMPIYILNKGTIETNDTGMVVGVSLAYIHLLCKDITYVVRRTEARGIRRLKSLRSRSHEEAGLPTVQVKQRAFRKYNGRLLRGKVRK